MNLRSVRSLCAVPVVAAFVAMTGCSTPSGAAADLLGVPDGVSLRQLHERPPIHRMTSSAAAVRIDRAKQRLIAECMARGGFTYAPAPAEPNASPTARLYPFGLESLAGRAAIRDEAPARETPHSKAFGRALYGDPSQVITARGDGLSVSRPDDGCMAEADLRLLGPERIRWMRLTISLHQADAEALRRLARDPEFLAATHAWRACMRRAGFNADHPRQLVGQLSDDAVAYADLRCKQDTRYLTIGYTRLADLQQRLLDENPRMPEAWKALQRKQDTVARTVLRN